MPMGFVGGILYVLGRGGGWRGKWEGGVTLYGNIEKNCLMFHYLTVEGATNLLARRLLASNFKRDSSVVNRSI